MIATTESIESITSDPDAQLMLRVSAGAVELFDRLFQRNEQIVKGQIRHMQGIHEDADDLSQQVFLKVFLARHSYRPTAKFTTWLFLITRNVVLNSRRTMARRREVSLRLHGEAAPQNLAELFLTLDHDPVDDAMRSEAAKAVEIAIQRIGTRQQEVIRLIYFKGLTYSDAGEKLNVSQKAVKSLLNRAKSSLRTELENSPDLI
ncbi:MAG: RNA polymerase sigma factor [Rubripirellula sp.]